MLFFQICLSVILMLYGIIMFIYLLNRKALFKILLINALSGVGLLLVLKLIQNFIKIDIYVNIISVSVSIILGPIGTLFNLLIGYIIF